MARCFGSTVIIEALKEADALIVLGETLAFRYGPLFPHRRNSSAAESRLHRHRSDLSPR